MIKLENDMEIEIREKMRGGNGNVKIKHIFKKEDLNGKCRLFSKISLAPGDSVGIHTHENEEEIYYVLCGKAKVNDNGEYKELNVGDAILTGNGEYHSIENIGHNILEFMAVINLYN